jgi:lipid-binding SYLF domain-containing protein
MQRYDSTKVVNVTAEMCSLQKQGLAIITVHKAGFLGSGRYGNGIAVARLVDGTWSAPSAIGLGGAGFGGQIGFELTDFVFVLNDAAAVQAFSQQGSLTLGGNVPLAAGPIGRNAEAARAASLKGIAGVFSYSKTKGLFAGVSLEGSTIVERRDANEKLYGQRYTASQLMEGSIRPPPAVASLMNVLNSRVFAGVAGGGDAMYNDVPEYDDQDDDVVWEGRRGSGYDEGVRRNRGDNYARTNDDNYQHKRANTWADDIYDRPPQSGIGHGNSFRNSNRTSGFDGDFKYSDSPTNSKAGLGRPAAPKPQFTASKTGSLKENQAVALFTFDPDQPGDLGFKKGDIITVIKKTDKAEDWWYVFFFESVL